MIEPKVCPYCPASVDASRVEIIGTIKHNRVACRVCGAESPDCETPEEAVEKWNVVSDAVTLYRPIKLLATEGVDIDTPANDWMISGGPSDLVSKAELRVCRCGGGCEGAAFRQHIHS